MKSKFRFISTMLILLSMVCMFTGCPWGDKPVQNYTVSYVSEYGETPSAIYVTDGTVLGNNHLPLLTDSEGKYKFLGWFIGDAEVKAGAYVVNSNITLTAKWEKIEVTVETTKYKVTFVSDYGTVPEEIELEDGSILTKTLLPVLEAEGYSFNGWLTEAGKMVVAGKFSVTEDVTLTASWTKNEPEKTEKEPEEKGDEEKDPEKEENEDPVEKGTVNFTISLAEFSDMNIISDVDDDTKAVTLSVEEEYDSYAWTITYGPNKSETKDTETITLTKKSYKNGLYVDLVAVKDSKTYSAQCFIKGE